jgi:hypothetical protein
MSPSRGAVVDVRLVSAVINCNAQAVHRLDAIKKLFIARSGECSICVAADIASFEDSQKATQGSSKFQVPNSREAPNSKFQSAQFHFPLNKIACQNRGIGVLIRSWKRIVQNHLNAVFELTPECALTVLIYMATCEIYGFAHENLEAARAAIENALSIQLEEAQEEMPPAGCYFRGSVPSGPSVQIRRNSGAFQRWHGDPSRPWYPGYGLLVFVHGTAPESIAEPLRRVPGLSFLEQKETM